MKAKINKIPCNTLTCRWCKNGMCDFNPCIKNQKCINFTGNLYYYFSQLGLAMENAMLPLYNLNSEVRVGIYYAMKVYNIGTAQSAYGSWEWLSFYGLEDEDKRGLTFSEIMLRKPNNEKFEKLSYLLFEGKLPPFEDEQELINKEKAEHNKKVEKINERNPDISKLGFGFLSPEGKFIEAEFGKHEDKALDICIARYSEEYISFRHSACDYLVKNKGWILFHNPYGIGKVNIEFSKIKKPTKTQINFIYDYLYSHGEFLRAEAFLKDFYCD